MQAHLLHDVTLAIVSQPHTIRWPILPLTPGAPTCLCCHPSVLSIRFVLFVHILARGRRPGVDLLD
jgi:hypothetical protein